jgi:photosystem II stability/assembly factor-like uncharacterized protein
MKTAICKILSISFLFSFVSIISAKESTEYSFIASKAPQALFLDITKNESNRVIAVGERGIILYSDNEGVSWTQAKVPTRATLNAVTFLNNEAVFAVGHDALILRSLDSGVTWETLFEAPELEQALFDISFVDENNGIAVGSYGAYFTSDDGGETWQDQAVDNLEDPDFGYPHFYSLSSSNDLITMVGEVGFIATSQDKGESWVKLKSPYKGTLFSVSENHYGQYIMGLRGNILFNDGNAWSPLSNSSTSSINGMTTNQAGALIAYGMDGVILIFNNATDIRVIQRSNRKAISSAIGIKDGFIIAGEDGLHRISAQGVLITQ